MPAATLTIREHSRDSAGLTYVYPVVSRRAGGLSIGINLNPNNACNWRCIYCQVPDLRRGRAPRIDLRQLETELDGFLLQVFQGDYLLRHVPEDMRRVNDIAVSGNGEPTSASSFAEIIDLIARVRDRHAQARGLKIIVITNGSLIGRQAVQKGLRRLAEAGGEIWFKLDTATEAGLARINSVTINPSRHLANLLAASALCPTLIQTCMFAFDDRPPAEDELRAYLDFLNTALERGARVKGVLLYGIARDSQQPEAFRLAPLTRAWLEGLAQRIEALGLRAWVYE